LYIPTSPKYEVFSKNEEKKKIVKEFESENDEEE